MFMRKKLNVNINCLQKIFRSLIRPRSKKTSLNIVKSPLGDIFIPEIPFHEFLFQNWKLCEDKIAVECASTGRKYTYKNLIQHSKALAASFQNKLSLSKGDFLGLMLHNCPEYPIAVLASSISGVVPVLINPGLTIDELIHQTADLSLKLIITDRIYFNKCLKFIKLIKIEIPIIVLNGANETETEFYSIDFFELLNPKAADNLKSVKIESNDIVLLPFSSGTSGIPKKVILTHRNVVANLIQISHPEINILKNNSENKQEVVFGVLPMFHIYGLMVMTFYSLKEGCRLFVYPKFELRSLISNLLYKKANILYVVPPVLTLLGHRKVSGKFFKTLNFIVSGSAPMSVGSAERVLAKASHLKIIQGYGMTETSPVLTFCLCKRPSKLSSVGIPVASTMLKICHLKTRENLPKEEMGELCAIGPQVMKSYWNLAENKQSFFDSDGWLRTGDIGYYDDQGDFFVVDRLKNLIKVKGFQVSPNEIELILAGHPKIKEAAVVAVQSQEHGEVPRAFVVLNKNELMTEEEVLDFVKEKLSPYKHLKGGVKFVQNLPKNHLSKVVRSKLENLD